MRLDHNRLGSRPALGIKLAGPVLLVVCGFAVALAAPLEDSTWKAILSFRPSTTIQRAVHARGPGWAVHRIEDGSGRLNLDYYSVNVTKLPVIDGKRVTAEELLAYVRRNINDFVATDLATFEPFTADDGKRWAGNDPAGAILLIRIYLAKNGKCTVPDVLPGWVCKVSELLDYGCVVVAESSSTRFRFSTIKGGSGEFAVNDRNKPGAHPVSGNREFGFSQRKSGGYAFYSIGADTATRPMDEFWGDPELRDKGFLAGDLLWRSYQERLVKFVNSHTGEAVPGFRESSRREWDWDVARQKKTLYDTTEQPDWVPR